MRNFNLIINTQPATEPVLLEDAKAHMRVTIDDDNDLIESMISAARQRAEAFTQRAFISQQWYLYFNYHHRDGSVMPPLAFDVRYENYPRIKLPYPPLISVDAFEYQATAGSWTGIDPTTWYADLPGRQIVMTDVLPEPAVYHSGFRVTFTVGYGEDGTDVPEAIKLAIKTFCLHLYENRSAYDPEGHFEVPAAGENLLLQYKIMDY